MFIPNNKKVRLVLGLALAWSAIACGSSDPTGSGGQGSVSFTTWGEEYIEQEIPADPGDGSGFVDGWSVHFERFLVNFQHIVVADASGEVAAEMPGSKLFDNTVPDPKSIVNFDPVEAKAWDRVSYEIAPVTEETELDASVSEDDREMMLDGGNSLYVSATATKDDAEKHLRWGFTLGTRYQNCHAEQDGRDELGLVVTNNAAMEAELTTHGDHFFYDRLQASPNPAVVTSLRFDAVAAADADDDGEVTLEELGEQTIDVRHYDLSGLPGSTLGEFVTSLARTVGHFRGEGECTISEL